MLQLFVEKYFALVSYCSTVDFNPNLFQIMHDEYAKAWQNLDQAEQGWITEQINLQWKKNSYSQLQPMIVNSNMSVEQVQADRKGIKPILLYSVFMSLLALGLILI